VLSIPMPRWGFWLFCASLFIGCTGAALELGLDVSYIAAQSFGWNWGENQRPIEEARFALTYTAALAVAIVPSLLGVDPLKLTMFSMAVTVLMLPLIVGPLVVIMNDKEYLKRHTNGPVTNFAVAIILIVAFAVALFAVPVQLMGG